MNYEVFLCTKVDYPPGCAIGPVKPEHFQLLFIKEGKGILQSSGRSFSLSRGQCFIVFPRQPVRYRSDDKNPWSISSVTFAGPDMADYFSSWGLSLLTPVLSFDDTCRAFYYIDEIIENQNDSPGAHWRVKGNLMKIIGEIERFALADQTRIPFDHVRKAILFMEQNYTQPIGVADIVASVCLERSYFSHLFKKRTGESPKDFLHRYRMDKAMELLQATSSSIQNIALSVGYCDSLHFSRNFKAYSGYTPSAFRKKSLGASSDI